MESGERSVKNHQPLTIERPIEGTAKSPVADADHVEMLAKAFVPELRRSVCQWFLVIGRLINLGRLDTGDRLPGRLVGPVCCLLQAVGALVGRWFGLHGSMIADPG